MEDNSGSLSFDDISRMLLGEGTDGIKDTDAYLVNRLVKNIRLGKINKADGIAYAKRQRYKENKYIKNYEDIDKPDNIIKKISEIGYVIDIVTKNSILRESDGFILTECAVSNLIKIKKYINVPTAQFYAKNKSKLTASFMSTKAYTKELFRKILLSAKYNLSKETVSKIQCVNGTLRIDGNLVDLSDVVENSSNMFGICLASLFCSEVLTEVYPNLKHLIIDYSVLVCVLVKSSSENPIDDLFKNSKLQDIVVKMPSHLGDIMFKCSDSEKWYLDNWVNLRNNLIERSKLSLSLTLQEIKEWDLNYYLYLYLCEKYLICSEDEVKRVILNKKGKFLDVIKDEIVKRIPFHFISRK